VALSQRAVASAAKLVVGVEMSVLNLVTTVATSITKSIGSVLGSVLGLFVQSVTAILGQSIMAIDSTFVASKRIPKRRLFPVIPSMCFCMISSVPIGGDPTAEGRRGCLLFAILTYVLIPIWVPLVIVIAILQASRQFAKLTVSKPSDWLRCQMETFSCQNNALSNALSAI
jgi:hypothetical protein